MTRHRSGPTGALWAVSIATLFLLATPARSLSAGAGFQHDAEQAIEVVSDSLEVAKDQGTAIFQGNVTATQGSLGLSADTLNVKYRQSDQSAETGSPFSRIDAVGNVVLTSPDEKATGDWAVYEVDTKTVTLGGAVVLTRGGNVINGQRLVIDLVTGRSKVDGGDVAVTPGAGKQRVRAVFTPAKKNGGD